MAAQPQLVPPLKFCIRYKSIKIDRDWWNSDRDKAPPWNTRSCKIARESEWLLWDGEQTDRTRQLLPVFDDARVSPIESDIVTVVKDPTRQKLWLLLRDFETEPLSEPISDRSDDGQSFNDDIPEDADPSQMEWDEVYFCQCPTDGNENWQFPHLWQVIEKTGGHERLRLSTPDNGFSSILPVRYFESKNDPSRCHLVGRLSILLAMIALSDRSQGEVDDQIRECFRPNPASPAFQPQDPALQRKFTIPHVYLY